MKPSKLARLMNTAVYLHWEGSPLHSVLLFVWALLVARIASEKTFLNSPLCLWVPLLISIAQQAALYAATLAERKLYNDEGGINFFSRAQTESCTVQLCASVN